MEKWFRKIAVITGASTCIGQQLIKDLSHAGLTVIGISRKKHIIDGLAHKTKSSGCGKIIGIECDISNENAIKNTFKNIENEFGGLHIMINNAGRIRKGETLNGKTVRDEELISTINFSLTGVVWCTREAYKLMQKMNEHAYIINVNGLVGTLIGEDKVRYANIYCATKYAVKNHTETVRLDLANANNRMIRVTSINPGCVQIKDKSKKINENLMPALNPKDVSNTILYLLSTPPEINITELTIKSTGFPL
uniref:CSON000022 protein n=1 Tax=Culicoides sonorensis TaxID=179676 RepID=A0A336MJ79_CULSO